MVVILPRVRYMVVRVFRLTVDWVCGVQEKDITNSNGQKTEKKLKEMDQKIVFFIVN